MTTTWSSAILIAVGVIGVAGWVFWRRIERWLDKPATVGATEEYGPELHAMKEEERELKAIAEECGLDLLTQRDIAREALALRLNVNELVDHCLDRLAGLEPWLDGWAPGWDEPEPVELPTFVAVHALIDDTSEFAVVEMVGGK